MPVPQIDSIAQPNVSLLQASELDLQRRIVGRPGTVAEQLAIERPVLRALPTAGFDSTEVASVRVDSKALVTVRQNRYSVPVALAGLRVSAAVGASEIRINHGGREVARHERLHGRFGTSAQLDHYLELLRRKPGGLERALPLAQERQAGRWPVCFDELWAALV
ncbi:MAG: transposase [Conexibacter sp.]|nr:transposase [Conexibacter sp.]